MEHRLKLHLAGQSDHKGVPVHLEMLSCSVAYSMSFKPPKNQDGWSVCRVEALRKKA
ncbi:UNVERIFIED_CONTAM: hypothetical protein Sangu_2582500 [Sesamum angustifolium]|uniref:Uncharacterized protein n=1 Tax=Sesamum angustifolium TaxID=2727405 RepID=A0AAW2J8W7_9LAMI